MKIEGETFDFHGKRPLFFAKSSEIPVNLQYNCKYAGIYLSSTKHRKPYQKGRW